MAVIINIRIRIPEWLDRIMARPAMVERRRKYGYAYRRIRLTGGKYTIVDPEDYYRLSKFDWCIKGRRGNIYAVRFDNNGDGRVISLHSEVLKVPKGLLVDHRNNNTLDNRSDNLRPATRRQNGCNSRIDKTKASSQYRGVRYRKKSCRWAANIRRDGKKVWLGSYKSEIEAARAYDEAARKYHGEFARLNFP